VDLNSGVGSKPCQGRQPPKAGPRASLYGAYHPALLGHPRSTAGNSSAGCLKTGPQEVIPGQARAADGWLCADTAAFNVCEVATCLAGGRLSFRNGCSALFCYRRSIRSAQRPQLEQPTIIYCTAGLSGRRAAGSATPKHCAGGDEFVMTCLISCYTNARIERWHQT
jgi:hypothetical protein